MLKSLNPRSSRKDSPVNGTSAKVFRRDGLPVSFEIGRFGHPEAVHQNAAHACGWRFSQVGARRLLFCRTPGFDASGDTATNLVPADFLAMQRRQMGFPPRILAENRKKLDKYERLPWS